MMTTVSAHFLICRTVVFLRDDNPPDESERWLWVILKAITPQEIDVTDPVALLYWAEKAGHAESKFECECQAVAIVKHLGLTEGLNHVRGRY